MVRCGGMKAPGPFLFYRYTCVDVFLRRCLGTLHVLLVVVCGHFEMLNQFDKMCWGIVGRGAAGVRGCVLCSGSLGAPEQQYSEAMIGRSSGGNSFVRPVSLPTLRQYTVRA